MIRRWWRGLRAGPPGRWIVIFAGSVGLGYLAVQLVDGGAFFGSFMRAACVAFALMVLLSFGHSIARGGEFEEVEASASGFRAKLREPLTRTRRAVGVLEQRVSSQMTTVNKRLYDLEKAVFKHDGSGTDEQE
jgi:hypothetical protein